MHAQSQRQAPQDQWWWGRPSSLTGRSGSAAVPGGQACSQDCGRDLCWLDRPPPQALPVGEFVFLLELGSRSITQASLEPFQALLMGALPPALTLVPPEPFLVPSGISSLFYVLLLLLNH